MDEAKLARLAARGIKPTTVKEFLGLGDADMKIVEFKVRLAKEVRRRREAIGLDEAEFAEKIESTQPRLAEIEANGPGVSVDELLHAFLATGGSLSDFAEVVVAGGE